MEATAAGGYGAFLTASSTFYHQGTPNVAQYGVFVSNSKGPGSIQFSYASKMGDSSFYIGGCPDCNALLRFVHTQNSPQGLFRVEFGRSPRHRRF